MSVRIPTKNKYDVFECDLQIFRTHTGCITVNQKQSNMYIYIYIYALLVVWYEPHLHMHVYVRDTVYHEEHDINMYMISISIYIYIYIYTHMSILLDYPIITVHTRWPLLRNIRMMWEISLRIRLSGNVLINCFGNKYDQMFPMMYDNLA